MVNANNKPRQLYIDEFGQTYTLEEETYVVGPGGQIQTLSRSSAGASGGAVAPTAAATYIQPHQQQFAQPILYQQQQQAQQPTRYL